MADGLTLLGGLTAEAFLRDYWQKKPLLVRNAIPGFQSPISPEELGGLAMEPEVESRLVLEKDGAKPWVWYAPSLKAEDGGWTLPNERHFGVVNC